jgi:UDP-glucose 4-epimerase
MMRRILVTGGTGYLGGRIVQALAKRDDVELILGTRRATPPAWAAGIALALLDWSSQAALRAACEGIESIVHLAALNDAECARDPIAAVDVNIGCTQRLVCAARDSGVRRFVYMSTAHVYGAPLAGILNEDTITRARHPYASSHRAAEDVVLASPEKLTGVVMRLSNGFGAPVDPAVNAWTLLANDLCRQAVHNRQLVLKSSGLQRRDFIAMHDVARATAHMLDVPAGQIGGGLFNVGGGRSTSVLEMAQLVQRRSAAVLGYTPEIIRPEPAAGEVAPLLDYQIDRLLRTGFSLEGRYDDEIDATLLICKELAA